MKYCSYLLLLFAIILGTSLVLGTPVDTSYDDENVEDDDYLAPEQPQLRRQQQRQSNRRQQQQSRRQSPPVNKDTDDYADYDDDYAETDFPVGDAAATRDHTRLSAGGESPRRVYEDTNNPAASPAHDPLDHVRQTMEDECNLKSARIMARLSIMDRILIALGPDFVETLPKPPNDTLATVPTPINITAEPCPYKYKRCSSETFFPSCDIPQNTDPQAWAQRFNLYFDLSNDFEKLDIINATLRLYKNNSIPLRSPKQLLIKAHEYSRSLSNRRRQAKKTLVAEKAVSSDYIGWVSLNIEKTVKRWRKARNNHGLQISVVDADTIPWDASSIFVIMNCSSGLVPLPFEVQTDEVGQRYPALNVRQGSPDDEFPTEQSEGVTEYIQADDPDVSDDDYDVPQSPVHRQSTLSGGHLDTLQNNYPHNLEHSAHHRGGHSHVGNHRSNLPAYDGYPYGTGSAERDMPVSGHPHRNGHDHMTKSPSNYDGANPHGTPHHETPSGDYLITNQATNLHHGNHHTRNFGHSQQGSTRHNYELRHHAAQSSMEDNIQSQTSEELNQSGEQRELILTTESSRAHRRGSGNTKGRHNKKNHHRQSRRGEERNANASTSL